MYEILVKSKDGDEFKQSLTKGKYTLGKADNADVYLPDSFASRIHAYLHVHDGHCELIDNNSTNGINSKNGPIKSAHITDNEEFFIGDLVLQINCTQKTISPDEDDVSPTMEQQNLSMVTPVDADQSEIDIFKKDLHAKLLEYLDLYKRGTLHKLGPMELKQEALEASMKVIEQHKLVVPKGHNQESVVNEVIAEAIGLGPLEGFMKQEEVTEVMVNGPDQIYLEKNGKLQLSDARFSSSAALLNVIERIVAPLGRRIDEGSPMVDARLLDGSRVNAIIPPLALNGPTLTIRKFSDKKFGISDLIKIDTVSKEMAEFLEMCVLHKKNMVVSGGTGSGKTTTLNILSNFIPSNERIVTIEDAAELQLHQDHVVSLESRPPNVEGKGAVRIRDLVKNSLRMRPDRIVVGECRGGEALDMLQAMNTGHDGSLTTAHANSPRDVLSRLEVMTLMSGMDLPIRAIREQISSAVDIIIQQSRLHDGTRRITSIVEVDGMEGDVILMQKLFEFKPTARTAEGGIVGHFTGLGYAPTFYRELENSGIPIDRTIFEVKAS